MEWPTNLQYEADRNPNYELTLTEFGLDPDPILKLTLTLVCERPNPQFWTDPGPDSQTDIFKLLVIQKLAICLSGSNLGYNSFFF